MENQSASQEPAPNVVETQSPAKEPEQVAVQSQITTRDPEQVEVAAAVVNQEAQQPESAKISEEHTEELERYQALLNDLDRWVSSTHDQLKCELPKFTSVSAVLKEMDTSQVRVDLYIHTMLSIFHNLAIFSSFGHTSLNDDTLCNRNWNRT